MPEEDDPYRAWLARLVSDALDNGARSLRAVVELCQGADPLTVRRVLVEILPACEARQQFDTMGTTGIEARAAESSLPPPHPLDYEWRFSWEGATTLLSHAERLGGKDLLLLGAATAGIVAGRQSWPGSVTAVDRSSAVVGAS